MKYIIILLSFLTFGNIVLTWVPSSNQSDPDATYNVYRTTCNNNLGWRNSIDGGFVLLGSTTVPTVTYTDSTVSKANCYSYEVFSVDSSGNPSATPSNVVNIMFPGTIHYYSPGSLF
jgi:hypothetical protein